MTANFSNRRAVAEAVYSSQGFLEPPPDLKPSVWAERSVVIPIGNAVPGPIRFDNAPYQREPLDMTANPECYRVSLMWGAQVGKAVSLDTLLPTPSGFRSMGEIEAGDTVFDEAGQPTRVVFATAPMLGRPCYRVTFDDGAEVICDRDHQWTVVDRGHAIRGKATNREITLTLGEMIDPHERERRKGRARYSVRNALPLEYRPAELPLDPYLYGVWLGDGCFGDGQIVLHESDGWIAEECRRRGYDMFGRAKDKRNISTIHWRAVHVASGVPVSAILRRSGLRTKERIAPEFLTASISQRKDLLAGLMDTDGSVTPRGTAEFVSKYETLALDVLHLAASLGIKPRITAVQKSCFYKGQRKTGTYWIVRFRAYDDDQAFLLPRKRERVSAASDALKYLRRSESRERRIVTIKPVRSVPVKCIQVSSPNSLYLIGRECIPTHNTLLALCAQGYRIEQNPTSQIMMQPSQGDLTTWLETKFNPLVEANRRLQELIAKPRGRDGVNNQRMKSYPGGFLMFSWAGSPKTMRGRSAPFIVCDETDGYDRSPEGDPVELLAQRAATFGDQRLLLDISTPTFKGASRIEAAYLAGDQRRFYVRCPHCGHHQILRWERVRWDKDEDGTHLPETARYHCDNHDPETGEVLCTGTWTDGERVAAIRNAEGQGAGWKASKPFRGHASYHLNELYSCFRKLREIVQSYLDKKAANDLQTFTNVSLAETWEEEGEQVEAGSLAARAEPFAAPVPAGAVVLTAGIDMQQDRLEMEVVGWGLGEESWSVDYRVLWGDPLQQDVWDDLDAVLSETWQHQTGAQLSISAACLDTGGTAGMTQAAYEYARGKTGRRLFAVKGLPGWGKPIVTSPSRKASGKRARKVDLFGVGVDEAKVVVTRRLGIQRQGPGYCHFPMDRDREYYAQITAEKLMTKVIRGFGIREWHKTRDRNEAFDCRVYALAALKILNPNIARLAKRFGFDAPDLDEPEAPTRQAILDSSPPPATVSRKAPPALPPKAWPAPEIAPEEPDPPPPQPAPKRAKRSRARRGSSWVNGW